VNTNRPPLESLSCQNAACQDHAKTGLKQLTIRKIYGADQIRYLRCQTCGLEFSERKNTALWNTRISETQTERIADCLAERNSLKAVVRIVKVDKTTVKRVRRIIGVHAQGVHDRLVQGVNSKVVEVDERHGKVAGGDAMWEATALDPINKLTVSLCLGHRDELLARRLLEDVQIRLKNRDDFLLLSDGFASYQTLFPVFFGRSYKVKFGKAGRTRVIHRIPRNVAHAVVRKVYQGKRLVEVQSEIAHGTKKCVERGLKRMGDVKINTSAIERSNLTNRSMNAYQVRKSAAFARRVESREALAWWVTTVLNFARVHRSLRAKLKERVGRRLYMERSPAMAAGIADHVWSTLELLRVVVPVGGGWR
jgi:IS1 family transposase